MNKTGEYMRFKIVDFTLGHVPAATKLALANYQEECSKCEVLPTINELPDLHYFAENGLGVVALEDDELVGYLGCFEPWNNAFGTTDMGTFSPIHAHGTKIENRRNIYQRMYQVACKKWIDKNISYHAIGLYEQDEEAKLAFFEYGFGQRCADAIRTLESIHANVPRDVDFCELPLSDFPIMRDLRLSLNKHLESSPCFMTSSQTEKDAWIECVEKGDRRTFVAKKSDGSVIAYLDVADEGENFVTCKDSMVNLKGAYCKTEYRGQGTMDALLDYVIMSMKKEGYTLLGVDYESINPTALHYWRKHFTPYTCSVTRRI